MTTDRGEAHMRPTPDEALPAEVWLRQPGAEAALTPREGFCCTAFRVRDGDGWTPVMAEPPSWEALHGRPAFYGNPLLFPFPMGLVDNAFTFRGQRYTPGPGREGRLIHGLVRDHAWDLDEVWEDSAGHHARATITNAGDPERLAHFPLPFRFTVTQTLKEQTLSLEYEATNVGDTAMPIALGIHPYFPIPTDPAAADEYVVRSDVSHLASVAPGATGVDLVEASGALDLRDGVPAGTLLGANPRGADTAFLAVYARSPLFAARQDGSAEGMFWSLEDRQTGRRVRITTSREFEALVLFAPATGHVISPVLCTGLPNAFNLHEHGQPSGTIELEPGESWRGWSRIAVEG